MSRTFKAFSMDPKVHVPPQFPGATADASRARAARLGSSWIGPWFLPLAALWSLVLALRHLLYDLGLLTSQTGALPTLVVGNVELGGTGKTPHVLDLTRRLEALLGTGTVGILSRGYGRSSKDFQWVSQASSWQEVGDEPWMMKQHLPSAPVAVGADRVRALQRMAAERPELRAVVLDDGLQHRALRPNRALGLVARPVPARGWGWARVLPAGPYRDLPARLRQCDQLVATTPSASLRTRHWTSQTQPSAPRPIHDAGHSDLARETPVLLVTGVAQPQRVVDAATSLGLNLVACAHYPDHRAFTAQDGLHWSTWLTQHPGTALLTTEKDAVRMRDVLPQEVRSRVWTLPIQVTWNPSAEVEEFLKSWAQTLPS